MSVETSRPAHDPAEPIYRLYENLVHTTPLDLDNGLGGKLLFAGRIGDAEENSPARQLLYAANIAGAASLAASAAPAALRQAMRDGVIDFMVNSLEEALRILKNEIRKRQAVSVGVAAAPQMIVAAMLERGVLPDLFPPASWPEEASGITPAQAEQFASQGALPLPPPQAGEAFVTWSIESESARDFALWLPKLDSCAEAVIPAADLARRRWVRLAPRYLGRLAHRHHGVALSPEEIQTFRHQVSQLTAQQPPESTLTISTSTGGDTRSPS